MLLMGPPLPHVEVDRPTWLRAAQAAGVFKETKSDQLSVWLLGLSLCWLVEQVE